MDDLQVGRVIRAVRMRRAFTQAELARVAGASASTVSLIERGHLGQSSVGTVRAVATVLEVSLPFAPRWRGPELAALLDESHSRLVTAALAGLQFHGWGGRPELTFSRWGSMDRSTWPAGWKRALPPPSWSANQGLSIHKTCSRPWIGNAALRPI